MKAAFTTVRVKVVPGASRNEIAGWLGQALKVRVAAPAEGGKANRVVIKLLADALEISIGQITITAGQASPRKTVRIQGVDPEAMALISS